MACFSVALAAGGLALLTMRLAVALPTVACGVLLAAGVRAGLRGAGRAAAAVCFAGAGACAACAVVAWCLS